MTEFHDHPGSVFAAFSGWKSLLIVPTVFFALAAYGASFLLPLRYASEALILTRPQDVPTDFVRSPNRITLAEQVASIRQLMLSRTNLTAVIREFDLYDTKRKNRTWEDRIQQIRDDITISFNPGHENGGDSVITLRFVGSDPQMVQKVTSKLTSLFIEQSIRARETETYGTLEFLQSQLNSLADRLTEQGELLRKRAGNGQTAGSVPGLEYEMLHSTYKTMFGKLEEARMTEYLQSRQKGAQFVIVDPAFLPERPVSPDRVTIMAIGALCGCLFGGMAIAGLSRKRRRIIA